MCTSNIILTSFRQGGVILCPISKRTPKDPRQIRVNDKRSFTSGPISINDKRRNPLDCIILYIFVLCFDILKSALKLFVKTLPRLKNYVAVSNNLCRRISIIIRITNHLLWSSYNYADFDLSSSEIDNFHVYTIIRKDIYYNKLKISFNYENYEKQLQYFYNFFWKTPNCFFHFFKNKKTVVISSFCSKFP